MSSVFGVCKDKFLTWNKGFDANGCAIVTFTEADPKKGCPPETCDVPLGPYVKSIEINGNEQTLSNGGTLVETFVNYVPYDEAIHVPGPLLGDGTEADPLQIPVREVNFTYSVYDPDVHDAGPVEGDGTVVNPWQIPVKECNFDYVAYDPSIHDLGVIEGSGTASDPWQIPLFELDTDLKICAVRLINTPVDGNNVYSFEYDVCDIDGNVVNTLVANNVPVPTFINKSGAAQTGEIQVMQQIDFVAASASSDNAATLFGTDDEGNCAAYTPQAINFVYVPYDEAVHNDGVIEGEGTDASPWQIPLPPEVPAVEHNHIYVDFDPLIHGATDSGDSAVEGDGSVANPFQIPRPCCDVVEPLCPDPASSDLAPETLNACPSGGDTTQFGLSVTELSRASDGYGPYISDASPLPLSVPGPWAVPIPAATIGCVIAAQIVWGAENGNRGANRLGDLTWAITGADVANETAQHYENTQNAGLGGALIVMDTVTGAAGSTLDLSFPARELDTGVVNVIFYEICADDSQPILVSDIQPTTEFQYDWPTLATDNASYPSDDFVADTACDSLAFVYGRHVLQLALTDTQAITDSDWLQFTGATELTDTTSWERTTGNPCEAGMGAALIEAGATWSVDASGNRSSADPAWINQAWLHSFGFDCERSGTVCEDDISQSLSIDYTATCDGDLCKTVTGSVDVAVAEGETIVITPIFDGVPDASQAITATASGVLPLNFTGPTFAVVEGQVGVCNFSLQAATTVGVAINTVDITTLTGQLGYK